MLTSSQRDRAVGAVVAMAVGDALGAGYEFQERPEPADVAMIGGGLGPFAPGEWTDDTSMAVPLLDVIAGGGDPVAPRALDTVADTWLQWARAAGDVGSTIRQVLAEASREGTASAMRRAADAMYSAGTPCAGNGSLMRTTPLTLAYLDDPDGLAEAARTYSHLTHGDPVAADACVLWNLAQRHAILHAELVVDAGMQHLPVTRRDQWRDWLAAAQTGAPSGFGNNGWVVAALQAAWAAIASTAQDGPAHVEAGLRAAVAAGHDTDTVAAIAGGLLGARWGVSAIPLRWRRALHGWPDITGQELVRRACGALGEQWPDRFYDGERGGAPVVHPHDQGVLIGDVFGLRSLPQEVDAVVSLCRLGRQEVPQPVIPAEDHAQVWLIDSPDPGHNPHLGFVAEDTVELLRDLRSEGKTVYLHCVHAHSRTPFIAALYAVRAFGIDPRSALDDVCGVLPEASPNARFRAYLDAVQP